MAILTHKGCLDNPVTIVQIVVDTCIEENGITCNAANPCLNTYHTCQDKCSYQCGVSDLWFTNCDLPYHIGVFNYTANIISVDHKPASCEIGNLSSTRANFRLCVMDVENCIDGSTWLSDFISAKKWFRNRRMNVWRGDCSQQLCEMQKNEFFLDRVIGPKGSDCLIYFDGKDVLNLAAQTNVVCPRDVSLTANYQYYGQSIEVQPQLGVNLDGARDPDSPELDPYLQIGNFIMAHNYVVGDAAQDKMLLGTRYLCIGNEAVEVEACINETINPTGWNFKLIDRAACGSELSVHETGTSVTIPKYFENIHVADVIRDLLENCAEMSDIAQLCCTDEQPYLIDTESFNAYKCKRPLDIITNVLICQPENVIDLIEELSREFMLSIYPLNGMVHVEPLCPPDPDLDMPIITADIIPNHIDIDDGGNTYNRVQYVYDQINCVRGNDRDNLQSYVANVRADTVLEPCDRRELGTISTQVFTSRWISASNAYLAAAYSSRWINWYSCPRRSVSFEIPTMAANQLSLNQFVRLEHEKVRDWKGEYPTIWLVKSISAPTDPGCTKIRIIETPFDQNFLQCFTCEAPPGAEPPMISAPVDPCEIDNCSMRMF